MATYDLFSGQADFYARYRPSYPDALYDFLIAQVPSRARAWDCATGNGQVATALSRYFDEVFATDISEAQLEHAVTRPNINYALAPAERTGLPDAYFDLVTVGQALHWLDFAQFFAEVLRVGKRGAVFAAWGYELLQILPVVDALVLDFYHQKTGPYWMPQRHHIENKYASVPFPFHNIQSVDFQFETQWQPSHLEGYLHSWSSVQKYKKATGEDPVRPLMEEIYTHWQPSKWLPVRFPVFMKWAVLR